MGDSLRVLLTGFGVVFFGLVCLIGIIYLMSFFVRLFNHEERAHKKKHAEVAPVPQTLAPVTGLDRGLDPAERRQRIAAVSAAIAEYLGTDVNGIRIHSIRRVGNELSLPERRELIAVISAALATEMGSDVSGIRITSIRRV